jgi:hypothetical protein
MLLCSFTIRVNLTLWNSTPIAVRLSLRDVYCSEAGERSVDTPENRRDIGGNVSALKAAVCTAFALIIRMSPLHSSFEFTAHAQD